MLKKLNKDYFLTIFLLILVSGLIILNLNNVETIESESTKNIIYDKSQNIINLSSLTLKQKIAQMIVTYGKEKNREMLQRLNIGGVHLGSAKNSPQEFINFIDNFQNGSIIPLFITVDLEGCINTFENFRHFPTLREIETKEKAYEIGNEEGKFLKQLGFNVNFAPVVDLEDNIWNCRNFLGSPEEVSEKAVYYINGIQSQGIIATSKHYPGKTLSTADPHKYVVTSEIGYDDLLPFEESIKNNVSAIMISHVVVNGLVNSDLKPSIISEKIVKNLRNNFTGLIITDDIKMLGVRKYYSNIEDMYIDVFKTDNDVILNFDNDVNNIYHMISVVEKAVKDGIIAENRIDDSIVRILNMKGIQVMR